jgi:hypothetical protein
MLSAFLSTYSYDIMGITESWLDATIDNNDLTIPGYLPPIRRDRNRHGGGVMVYLSDKLPHYIG